MARVRRTHAKFVALNAAADSTNPVVPAPEPASEHEADEKVLKEKGWRPQGEVGREEADDCLNWMGSKVLQHAGFQGQSRFLYGMGGGLRLSMFCEQGAPLLH